jgi:hypothetical protein
MSAPIMAPMTRLVTSKRESFLCGLASDIRQVFSRALTYVTEVLRFLISKAFLLFKA